MARSSPVASDKGCLVICPTPLGNLGDVTLRTIERLERADTVCAEDTRVTGKLLAALGIEKPLERLDENRIGRAAKDVVARVLAGEVIAYCSDAGMPGVSDPGLRLVRAAREAGAPVEVLPGPTAVATAYVASGAVDPRFYFGGFFPRKDAERAAVLDGLRDLPAALVFYESPNRLVDSLRAVVRAFPHRAVSVCRELTKLHEEVVRGSSSEVLARFEERLSEGAIKGEIALVIEGPGDEERAERAQSAQDGAAERAASMAAEGARAKDIARTLANELGIPRNTAYDLALAATKRVREL
ncbi:16S rRNA (cytidine(1402)-2'-O)-methyltransferase [Eggerthellaceae bacterium zg-1084]|uniref:16S rRNA (cytidine(1402)-2'-O)-methyltransferase n=1 Tax=Berryella wangjianweii TaxID=2734634 RepID=UPI00155433F4|nr:16S rRNA (cytidine(1402)-2'-O)-methyltransferase [Berryella wangjianweii]NPD30672.1 16S rRNA (cytidine(1402)-2'-O)-methyltransferase [Berryella wangjianweii]NPD32109.1 16S rRNA (cytidine(1402)-2'-O)-methyltransferase [Eggerthellaceae bacterium zg-997]